MEFQDLVFSLLERTCTNIFVTGKAGTGKTTLLHRVKSNLNKNFVVVAPTSVAAINASGVTMHSFFQIPFGPLVPQININEVDDNIVNKYAPEKLKLIRALDLIIVDEISMVRSDVLDYLDHSLRQINRTAAPFGGIQLLMIGDPYQLPPIKDNWTLLEPFYESPYFFDSIVLKNNGGALLELTKVYRQSEESFISILNSVRTGAVDESLLAILNERVEDVPTEKLSDYITVTTHNRLVSKVNHANLGNLAGELFKFEAVVSGDFPTEAFPVDKTLQLKVGARVMMIRNDDSGRKTFYNGRTAYIVELGETHIRVAFSDDGSQLNLMQQTWHNIKYSLDHQIGKVTENSTGSFTQYPIKLAWAITVHKSQGLTFDKAIIDIADSFEAGQAYVALSRCRTWQGMVLRNPVSSRNIITDSDVVRFMESQDTPTDLENFLTIQESANEHRTIKEFLDLSLLEVYLQNIKTSICREESQELFLPWISAIEEFLKDVVRPSEKFYRTELMELEKTKSLSHQLQSGKRLQKAAGYFVKKIDEAIKIWRDLQSNLPEEKGKLNELIKTLLLLFSVKHSIFCDLMSENKLQHIRFKSKQNMLNLMASMTDDTQTKGIDLPHAELYKQIQEWRRSYSSKKSLPLHIVLAEKTIEALVKRLPRNHAQLASVPGLGPAKVRDIGDQLLKIINDYFGTQQLF